MARLLPCRGLAFAVLVALAVAGCGGSSSDSLPREPVSGKVTLDGQPLAEGTIQFLPASEGQGMATASGGMIKDGSYSVPRDTGPVPGTYKVMIFSSGGGKAEAEPGKGVTLPKELIPPQYNAQTTLTAEVKKGGDNTFNFDLKSKPEG
ncbi:MAG: hypothetical protein IRY99_18335 [Isosphaeraceae bacterium]|nr:hypothetical protein [Isosphaeraceae bacterium]